jgi:hypothetical protein
MMHGYRFLLYYLWIAPHILLALVAIVMRVKRLDVSFPLFAIYTWYEVAEFVLLFAIAVTKLIQGMLYMRVFLVTLAVSTALRFGILQEIFNNVFREHGRADAIARVLLRWTTGILLAAAISCAIFAPGPTSSSLIAATAWLGRGIAIIQCGLVLFLLVFSRLIGLSLQSYVFGIALGFGILSTVELANWAMRSGDLTESTRKALDLLTTGSYHVAVLLWLAYLIVPAKRVLQHADVPAGDVEQWNRELERFLR